MTITKKVEYKKKVLLMVKRNQNTYPLCNKTQYDVNAISKVYLKNN